MSKLTTKQRNALPESQFALRSPRSYPIPDRIHAANAKARAAQQVGKTITPGQQAEIDRKADAVLKKDR